MTNETLLKIIDWATGEGTGASSEAICRWMLGLSTGHLGWRAPSDYGDRGRCIRLLNLIPEWWDRLDEMASIPSQTVTFFKKGGMGSRQEGWAEQILLIKKESDRA